MSIRDETYRAFLPFSAWAEATVNTELWGEYVALFERAKTNAPEAPLKAALAEVNRTAALETGALENLYSTSRGLTVTVAAMTEGWQTELDRVGADVRGHFEAQLVGFEMAFDLATRREMLSAAWIRELHRAVARQQTTHRVWTDLGWQDHDLHHGEYKSHPNNVLKGDGTTHWYAGVDDVSAEMQRLLDEARSETFEKAHPVIQAAYVHHAFVCIHPFEDGNGRVARALASVFTYRALGLPLVVMSDQQVRYWDALSAADEEDFARFVRFIEDRVLDTLATLRLLLEESGVSANALTASERIIKALQTPLGRTEEELIAIGRRTELHMRTVVEAQLRTSLQSAPGVELRTITGSGIGPAYSSGGYIRTDSGMEVNYEFYVQGVRFVSVSASPIVSFHPAVDDRRAYAIVDRQRGELAPLFLSVDDLDPEITSSAELRLNSWARTLGGMMLGHMAEALENSGVESN